MQVHLTDSLLGLGATSCLNDQIVNWQTAASAQADCILDQLVRGKIHGGDFSLCVADGPASSHWESAQTRWHDTVLDARVLRHGGKRHF